jgi:NAD(P)-dependent dehydrogenase (short-subunit alcohol dehydrogenase family)
MTQQNRTALLTGASRGIGRATAAALARAGAHVLVHYGRSAREAESLVSEIHAEGGFANAISADLGTPNGAELLAKQVRSSAGDRLDARTWHQPWTDYAQCGSYADTGSIGGFPPARREVVQKSAWRKRAVVECRPSPEFLEERLWGLIRPLAQD